MRSNVVFRGLWIVTAGACIALGAGHGVASAEEDSTNGAPGPSSTQTSESSPLSAAGPSRGSKGTGASQDSTSSLASPATTVSASTVTGDRDRRATSKPFDRVTATLTSIIKRATTPTARSKLQTHTVAPDPAAPADVETAAQRTESTTIVEVAPPVAPARALATATPATAAPAPPTEVAPGNAALRSLAAPVAHAPPAGPLTTVVVSLLSAFGALPPTPPVPAPVVGGAAATLPIGVTGVKVGRSDLQIPVGTATYTGAADWYFPTQADGTVQAQGVILLQHGFLGSKSWYSALARQLAQQTNSVVVVPNIPSFPFFTCRGCTLSGVPMQEGVAALFVDPDRTSLNASAAAAGYQGTLPEKFILTGHSAGGGLAAAAGGFYTDDVDAADSDLLGVVMYDGVSSNGTFADALASLDARNVPVYQIAAPAQSWNAEGQTTDDLVALRPGQFVGVVLANGSHVDSLIGGVPIIDFLSELLVKPSPPGNTEAVYTLATGWINDMYAGRGPTDPLYGSYGEPDQYLVLGQTAAVVLGPPPVVDVDDYLGTWYEVGSVKQFFSIGLVNTTAIYSLNPDGSIRVENSGDYFFNGGPESKIVGSALPVDATNSKLNVTFFGPASATPPGNYWIVDRAPDYSWAIVTDPSGRTGFLLSRTPTVSDALYQELLNRASVKGVKGWITRTRQPAAGLTAL